MSSKSYAAKTLIVVIALLFMLSAGAGDYVHAGKDWEGIPTITMQLPGKTDAHCKKVCAKKEGEHAEAACDCAKYVTVGIDDVERYHGDIGPGVAIGYRACQIAFAHLYPGEIPPRGDQFVVSGSAKACPGDAVSYVTGARYGKGPDGAFNSNLVFDDTVGFFSFIFAGMTSGKAIKLSCKFEFPEAFKALNAKMKTDPEAKEAFFKMSHCISLKVLTQPDKELFDVTELKDFNWKECKEKCPKKE